MSAPRNSLRPWVIGLGLPAVGLAGYLLLADTPWDAARESAERIAAGKRARPEADFVTALWITAAANLSLVMALLATVRLWAPRLKLGPGRGFDGIDRPRRGFWICLGAVILLGGAARLPLASGSLWWDELWGIKYSIVGYYIGEEDAPVEDRHFAESNWRRALWYYTRPTNHPAASFPARLSHVVWKAVARPEAPHAFSDLAVRFPNFLASLGAVAAVALVGARGGMPAGGLMAALVLAIHPWAIRHGVDLRGYSWVMLWTAAGLLWLLAVFRAGRSRWWAWWGLGINQALLVWSFPHAVFVAMGLFGAAVVLIMRGWEGRRDRLAALGRLLLVNVAAGMLFIQVFSPNLLQMSRWLDEVNANHNEHAIGADLLKELVFDLFGGGQRVWELANLGDAGWAIWLAVVGLAGAVIVGIFRWWRLQREMGIALTALLISGAALLAAFAVSGTFFYPRFSIFIVIPFALLLGAVCAPTRGEGGAMLVGRIGLFAAFLGLTAPQSRSLLSFPFSPFREVAERVLEIESREAGAVIFVVYGHGAEMMPLYAPEARSAVSLAELETLAAEARAKDARLLVAYGYPAFNRVEVPDGFLWLDDRERFAVVDSWEGIDPDSSQTLLEWRGDSARE